jgi:hypothetical protein
MLFLWHHVEIYRPVFFSYEIKLLHWSGLKQISPTCRSERPTLRASQKTSFFTVSAVETLNLAM